ncbi:hypothetical protein [Paraburkholderia phenoliruptrix]|uniref:hypothetical protein n=1 Tax=Paraburkholderia phenoliruptrix TaxID=252970 RepID=UPI001C4E51E8|nr:hypothetical protein [Paraburkholderia phenoliruptrix]MBW0448728.1 hypothetical protein [Paraburkholderia phenoliruptrix]MBW9100410.1 hypothetical protein [Paraburkholderia phenoliruptrix]
MRVLGKFTLPIVALGVTGCSDVFPNEFTEHFTATNGMQSVSHSPEMPRNGIYLLVRDDIEPECRHLADLHFRLLGTSRFRWAELKSWRRDALAQAREIGAEVVVVSRRPVGTVTKTIRIQYPDNRTQLQKVLNPQPRTMLGTPLNDEPGGLTSYQTSTVQVMEYSAYFWLRPSQK